MLSQCPHPAQLWQAGAVDTSALERMTYAEKWWQERYWMLAKRGYQLRCRLRPYHVPAWEYNPRLDPYRCEDGQKEPRLHVAYATRYDDNSQVVIKRCNRTTKERSIAARLSSATSDDEDNHCIPILDTFVDETDNTVEFIVMPLLRRFNSPPFRTVGEVVDFMRQTLEGLAYMHERNVAHRNCTDDNIMLDASQLFSGGFHPIHQHMKPNLKSRAKFRERSAIPGGVRYYFTGFRLSTRFKSSDSRRRVRDRTCSMSAPEFSKLRAPPRSYDPFRLDIYLLGDVFKRHFIEVYFNAQFLMPLVNSMVEEDPRLRPTASEALQHLDLVSQVPASFLRSRLVHFEADRSEMLEANLKSVVHGAYNLARCRFPFSDISSKKKRRRHTLGDVEADFLETEKQDKAVQTETHRQEMGVQIGGLGDQEHAYYASVQDGSLGSLRPARRRRHTRDTTHMHSTGKKHVRFYLANDCRYKEVVPGDLHQSTRHWIGRNKPLPDAPWTDEYPYSPNIVY